MSKRILAILMAVAMAFSLLPVTAFAVDGSEGPEQQVTSVSTDANNPIQIKKSINDDGDTLTLEAYLTNEVTETVSTKPLDIVLVLDQSGSMAYDFGGNRTNDNTARRQYAMKSAVTNFIDKVNEQYSEKGDHRMAIVTFGSEATTLVERTLVDANGTEYLKNTVSALPNNPEGATNVGAGMDMANDLMNSDYPGSNTARQKVVIVFTDGVPTTQSDFNTGVANAAITASKKMKNTGAVVYTVGIFNGADPAQLHGDKYDRAIVSDDDCDGTVGKYWGYTNARAWFSGGAELIRGLDIAATNRFLNYLSSNFTAATEIGIKEKTDEGLLGGQAWEITQNFDRDASNYYLTATDADGLNSVFQQIIEEISTLDIEAGTDAILSDTLSEYFELNIPESATETKDAITVEQWDCIGKSGNDYTWQKADPQPTGLNVTVNGKTINVTGFDYTEKAVTATTKNGGTDYSGSKLVVTIPIKADTSCETWTSGSNFYPTNDKAGLSNYTDKDGTTLATLLTDSPQVEVTKYTVTYNANGGHFGTEATNTTKVETIAQTGTHPLNYTVNYTPTYTNADGKTYVFLGWSAEQLGVLGSTADASESADKIITSVNVPATGATVYAVWGLDDDENGIPDVFEATVTYAIEHGYWFDSATREDTSTDPVSKTFTLYTKNENRQWVTTNATLGGTIPTGHGGDAGYTADGWYQETAATDISSSTPVTGDVTYTFKYVPVSQPTTYTVVLHLEGGAYTKVPTGYTETGTDGVYQYTVTETTDKINPDTAALSRSGYNFQGWSLSDTAPQTLIEGDKTFSELSVQQNILTGEYDKINLYAVWANVAVSKKVETVGGVPFNKDTTVAHVGDKIVWSITVTNKEDTPATVTLMDTMADAVYTNVTCETEATNVGWNANTHTWTATVEANDSTTYYVHHTVTQNDVYKGNIVNTVTSGTGNDAEDTDASEPVPTWDTKQLKSAQSLTKDTSGNWITTVTLTLPTVEATEPKVVVNAITNTNESTPIVSNTPTTSAQINAVSAGSYVIDQIGNEFTFVPELTLKVGDAEYSGVRGGDNNTYNFGNAAGQGTYPYTVTYTDATGDTPAQFKWDINESVPAGTKVTLSYKLKLTSPKTAAGTYGVEDLNGNGGIEESKALYTNESAILYDLDRSELAVFPKPSVSYTVQGSSGGHSSSSRPTLNTKDHYGFVVGYPDGTVQPEGKITRAEVATIYFRMLTDESRTKFWSQSNEYSDVKAGDWFNNAVSTLSNAGIISGYEDGSFRPNGYITRAEFATIAARFFDAAYSGEDLFPDIDGHWAKDYINQAANKGFVNGYEDGTFKPNQNITRAEAVTLVNRTLDRHPDKSHFTKDMLTWPDNQDETKWYYADMQEATNSHTYESKENSDKSKYENWTKTLSIRNWEALEKEWSDANSSQGTGNVV